MAASGKRRMLPPPEDMNVDDSNDNFLDGDDDNDESNESDDGMINQEIQVDFEARAPVDSDFHGIQRLLHQLFLKAHINLSELTNLILHQNYIGSVIKQSEFPEESDDDDDEEDPVFGIITVLNITEKRNVECIKQLKEYLLSHCKKAGNPVIYQTFHDTLMDESSHTGLLISERFLNLPPTIAAPMYESLRKEIQAAVHKKMKLDFKNFILISKFHKADKITANRKRNITTPSIVYSNPEEELILEEAQLQFEFSVQEESDSALSEKWDADDGLEMRPFRKIMLIPTTNLDNIISKIKSSYI